MKENELLDEMIKRLGQEVKDILARLEVGQVSGAALEVLLRQQLWHFGGQCLGVLLEALDRQVTAGQAVHDHRTRTVVSLFGPVDISRSRCQEGRYPLDESLGLIGQQGWTAAVQEACSLLSCECGFETVSDLLRRLLGLSLSPPTVQQVAEQSGRRAEELLEARRQGAGQAAKEAQPLGDTLIMAVDGCQAPQRDGWHEVKVAVIYPQAARYKKASGRGQLRQKEYLASLEKVQGFGRQLWQTAQGQGVDKARRVVGMGDGAPWIWNLVAEHFPQAVEIVDFYHAVEHLWTVGETLWGDRERSAATRGWVRHYRRQLRRGRVDLVIAALARALEHPPAGLSDAAAATVRRNREYFQENRSRMRYDQYRRWRLPIGTGAVEGSCKFVVQSRFKRPGSRWSANGLANMLALKLMRLNHHWELLWPHLQVA